MKKFLRYQLELKGTSEDDLTEDFCEKLNADFEKDQGIYNELFGETVEVAAHAENNTIVLCGCIIGKTQKECKAIYATLKATAKATFKNCKKTSDLLVGIGDKLF